MAGLIDWVNGDNWAQIKTKFSAAIALLNGGTSGQFFGSNGPGNLASWKTFLPTILGGNQGDVLIKLSADDNDYGWRPANPIVSYQKYSNINVSTSHDFSIGASPTGAYQRNNLISFSILATSGDSESACIVELYRGTGDLLWTGAFAVLDSALSDVNLGKSFATSFLDPLADAGSTYKVVLTKSSGATIKVLDLSASILSLYP